MVTHVMRDAQLEPVNRHSMPLRVSPTIDDSYVPTRRPKRSTSSRSPGKLDPLGRSPTELTAATRRKWFEDARDAFELSSLALQLAGDPSSRDALDRQLEPISHPVVALEHELARSALLIEATGTSTAQTIDAQLVKREQECVKQSSIWTPKTHPVADANASQPQYARSKPRGKIFRYKPRAPTRTAVDPILSSEARFAYGSHLPTLSCHVACTR
ncbi:hypothetical protein PybrP1_011425 [[Pythium] brassicae (nom. inval.)]|nr:hypothetical protein PybrP1_011425 [[Pythium] brassicae (nom. inval.)]